MPESTITMSDGRLYEAKKLAAHIDRTGVFRSPFNKNHIFHLKELMQLHKLATTNHTTAP